MNGILASSLEKQVSAEQLVLILDALAGSSDPALVARFPAVLSICARQGLALDSQALLSRYWVSSPKRQMLEKLLLLSAALFNQLGLPGPRNLDKIAASLKARHPAVCEAAELSLAGGGRVSREEMRACLEGLAAPRPPAADRRREAPPPGGWPSDPAHLLGRLFSSRQIELLGKRVRGEPFTKTEREYFSRTVRKKLAAIVDPELQAIAAQALARPKRGARPRDS